jgi:Uncharacterized protein conserved in bacteria
MHDSIKCPKCGESINISETISRDVESALRARLEKELGARSKEHEAKIREEAAEAARTQVDLLKKIVSDKDKRLEEARSSEIALRRMQSELEDKARSLEIEIGRRMNEEKKILAERIARDIEEAHHLKDAEKEKQLSQMRRQIEDLKRKAEQGSQQSQGEVLELDLESKLREEFPFDIIDPVEKGRKGGDALHTIKTQSGRECGKILWETKRTKVWSDSWIQKLKDDQREAKADLAVIVSEALPRGLHHFRDIDGVWVTDISSSIPLALALRLALIKEDRAKQSQTGKEGKMEVVYNYLTGVEFRNRVQAIMEAFVGMKQDLDAEKRSTEKVWARREKNMEKVVRNIAGMHGELDSMAGQLPAVKLLELPQDTPALETETIKEI